MPLPGDEWARPDDLLAALENPEMDQIKAMWAEQREVCQVANARGVILEHLRGMPEAVVHGDCHTGNIVHGNDGLGFCDWQAFGIARASSDLAFLSVRATPSGVPVPDLVLQAHQSHGQRLGVAMDPARFRWAVALEELAILIFQWPAYAAYNNATGISRVRRRASRLVELLGRDLAGPHSSAATAGAEHAAGDLAGGGAHEVLEGA